MLNPIRRPLSHAGAKGVALTLLLVTLAGCDGGLPGTVTFPTATSPAASTAISTAGMSRPDVEVGIAVPAWNAHGYSTSDKGYHQNIADVKAQTGSRWVTLSFTLFEASYTSTVIGPGASTTTPANLVQGIEYAHSQGLKVYVEPLLRVGTSGWGGFLKFNTEAMTTQWFTSYWAALSPYMAAAQQAGADQFALATELMDLEPASDSLWEGLIANAHAIYHGQLIYAINHDTPPLTHPRPWMSDSSLFALGISAYWTIKTPTGQADPDVTTILDYWQTTLLPQIDAFVKAVGHPVIFSEIGYRNSQDTLRNPFSTTSSTPADPTLQAAAYSAAIQAVFGDKNIIGILFWAWKNDLFTPAPQTITAMHSAFTSPAA